MGRRMPKRRDDRFEVRVDHELYEDAREFAEENHLSVAAIVRWFLRRLTSPTDPITIDQKTIDEIRKEEEKAHRRRKRDMD